MSTATHTAQQHTGTGIDNRKLLMWMFLASDTLFFGAIIATFLVYHGRDTVGPTPKEIFDIPLTSYSAFLLLVSSLTMAMAVGAIHRGRMGLVKVFLALTALFGIHFLANQVYEFYTFVHEGLTPRTNLFGTTFYTLTGFHGAHVTIGVLWLLSILAFIFRGKVGPQHATAVEVAGLYWHFVDIVWIVIFGVVYLIGTTV